MEKLQLQTSNFDLCLFISTKSDEFGIFGMQTDDTLTTYQKDPTTIQWWQTMNDKSLNFVQKTQGQRLKEIEINSSTEVQEYIEQRARGAYIATICQPEATYELSIAAQYQNPTPENNKSLNKVIRWQMLNQQKGIKFILVDLWKAGLFIFVDASFANNKDLSSQIGFIIVLANEKPGDSKEEFLINGSLIHYSSVKSKRVTRSVLASELYAMVHGYDIDLSIETTLDLIAEQLMLKKIPIIMCTDSFSLYECMLKLGTTSEKRLMIDITALPQSYERRELAEIRWISRNDNPADAMTKSMPTVALKNLIERNGVRIRVEGWVERPKYHEADWEAGIRCHSSEKQ
ncbi:hypothetical protein EV44_g1966 [Erysiphe necator]|uniref:Uncharacterized protein n=1 Tax=Uncinula necator TaxID=52586 RepID=A0A0B1P5D5_UNCNE|nr:hypothetical protein EV44_g1966 [Erysiphe necator]